MSHTPQVSRRGFLGLLSSLFPAFCLRSENFNPSSSPVFRRGVPHMLVPCHMIDRDTWVKFHGGTTKRLNKDALRAHAVTLRHWDHPAPKEIEQVFDSNGELECVLYR